jgi:hypothetical protein
MERTEENITQNKKSFILYLDSADIFEKLSDEEAGKLIKAVLYYVHTGDNPPLDRLLDMAFVPIKQALHRDLEKWRNILQRNKDNGLLGGRPKRCNPEKPKKPSGLFGNPEKPRETQRNPKNPDSVNVSVSVNESVNVTDNNKIQRENKKNFVPPSIEDVNNLIQERGYTFDAESFVNFYQSKGWLVGNVKMKDWKACCVTWQNRLPKVKTREQIREYW